MDELDREIQRDMDGIIFVLQAIVRARLEAEDPMGLMALTRAQEEREDFALWEEELRG